MRLWWIVLVALIALPAQAVTVKRGPGGSSSGGGGASMVAFCEPGGQKGVGYDTDTGKYEKVCANYNWSNDTSVTFSGNSECVRSTITCSAAFGNGGEDNSCLYAGQVLTTSCVAPDYWYAWDNVRKPGGEIWLPAGTYEINGCGDSGGATKACPVVYQDAPNIEERPSYDFHTISFGLGTTFHGAGQDMNGMRDGRLDGTVFLNDTGEHTVGVDAVNGTTVLAFDTVRTGVNSGPNNCGASVLDGPCDFDRAINLRSMPESIWGANLTLLEDIDYRNAVGSTPMRICVSDDVVTEAGFCSHDKREICTGANQAAADAVCAALSAGATCFSEIEAVEDELSEGCTGGANCNDVHLIVQWNAVDRFNNDTAINVQAMTLRVFDALPTGCDLGTGGRILAGVQDPAGSRTKWAAGMDMRRLETAPDNAPVIQVVHPLFFGPREEPAAQNFTVMPSSWWGRDDDGDGASGVSDADCVDGDAVGAGDETECDSSALFRMGGGQHASVSNVSFFHGSAIANSNIDGSQINYDTTMRGITVAYSARGQISDSGRSQWFDSEFRDNSTSFALISMLASGTRYENIRFMRNYAGAAFACKQGINSNLMASISLEGNFFTQGMFDVGNCGVGTVVRDVVGKGNAGVVGLVSPDGNSAPMGVTFNGINLTGQILPNTQMSSDFTPKTWAAFAVTDVSSGSGITEFQGLKIEDVHITTPIGDVALVYLEDDGTNDATDWARYLTVKDSTLFSQVGPAAGCTADKEPWPCCTSGAPPTGATCLQPQLVVVGNGTTGEDQASEATEVLELVQAGTIQEGPPRMEGNRLFWLNSADSALVEPVTQDWTYTCREADEAGDCDNLPHGGRVCIVDDTAAGACTDAGADGILDGGGTATSVCVCNGSGTFSSSP